MSGRRTIAVALLAALACAVPATASAGEPVRLHRAAAVEAPGVGHIRSGGAQTERAIELGVSHPNRLQRLKRRAARREANAGEGTAGPESAAAVFGGLNMPGLTADGTATPPDSTGAIGPGEYVEMVNNEFGEIGVFDRADLGLIEPTSLNNFVGVPETDDDAVFDPQVQWDPVSGRWYYVADYVDSSGASDDNWLAFGWSFDDDADPLPFTDWCRFLIQNVPAELEDYPKLGHNDNHVIFGTNVFDADDDFVTARVWALAKPATGDNACTAPAGGFFGTAADPLESDPGVDASTPVPANTFESSADGYVVAAEDPTEVATANEITAWHVSGSAGAPTLTEDGDASVGSFDVPANVPQPGTIQRLDSLDGRLTQAVGRTDPDAGELAVWTQHTVAGPGGRAVVRWYELLPDDSPAPAARQQGTISDPSQFVFNAAISPTDAGDEAVIDYNVGGSSLLAQIRAGSRESGTPLGQVGGPVTLGTSVAAARDFSCDILIGDPCRWGDYAGASPDPADADLVWGTNQTLGPVSAADAAWRTRNFALTADTTAPDTTIDSGPAAGSTVDTSSTSFGFSSDDPSASFQCKVDGASFAACASPRTIGPLTNSGHTFEVRAIGGGGMVDPTPAARSFTVDAPGPTTEITNGPKRKVKTKKKRAKARFEFTASETEASARGAGGSEFSFECRLDKDEWKSCSSPRRVKVKAKRRFKQHAFRVRATNVLDVTGPAAKRKWKLKRKR